jgi:hypothetical protein
MAGQPLELCAWAPSIRKGAVHHKGETPVFPDHLGDGALTNLRVQSEGGATCRKNSQASALAEELDKMCNSHGDGTSIESWSRSVEASE